MRYLLDTYVIISTAIAEGLTVISADENMQKYKVAWVW
jgi:PIN domain nuclease of toxin-antitoxin system